MTTKRVFPLFFIILLVLSIFSINLSPVYATEETFGETGTGSNNQGEDSNYKDVSVFSCTGSGGTLTKLTIRCWQASGSLVIKGVVYSDNSGEPDTLLATSDEVTITASTATWTDLPMSGENQITVTSSTNYHLGFIAGGTSKVLSFRSQAYTGDYIHWNADTYSDGPASTFGSHSNVNNRVICIYATYTVGGATTEKFSFPTTTKTLESLNWKLIHYFDLTATTITLETFSWYLARPFSLTSSTKTTEALTWNLIHLFNLIETTKTLISLTWNLQHYFSFTGTSKTTEALNWFLAHSFGFTETTKTIAGLTWNLWHTFGFIDITKTIAIFNLAGVTKTLTFSFEITTKMLETFTKSWIKTFNFPDTTKTLETWAYHFWHVFSLPITSITGISLSFTPPVVTPGGGVSIAWIVLSMFASLVFMLFAMAYSRRR